MKLQFLSLKSFWSDTCPLAHSLIGVSSLSQKSLLSGLVPLLFYLGVFRFIFSLVQSYFWERSAEAVCRDLRTRLLDGFLKSQAKNGSVKTKTKNDSSAEADLASLMATDIRLLKDYLVHFYGGVPRELLQIFCLATVSFFLSFKLFCLFFFFMLPLGFVLRQLGKKLLSRSKDALFDYSQLSEWLQLRLNGIETIKHYKSESQEFSEMKKLSQKNYNNFLRLGRVKARTAPISEWFAVVAIVLVFFIALTEIRSAKLTASVALSFFAQIAFLSQSAGTLARYFNQKKEGSAALERLLKALEEFSSSCKDLKVRRQNFTSNQAFALELQNIDFSYDSKKVFENFSCQFKKNEITVIKGPSGVGKTSLFSLILGVKTPQKGRLFFHSSFFKEEQLQVAYMPQKPLAMHASLAENICYPKPYHQSPKEDKNL